MNAEETIDRFAHLKPGDPWPEDGLEWLGKCPVCDGVERTLLYEDLTDRLSGAAGRWALFRCKTCKSGYLDPRPNRLTITMAYQNFYTHEIHECQLQSPRRLKCFLKAIRNGYLNRKFGYRLEPSIDWGFYAMQVLPPPLRLEWDHFARHLPKPVPGHNRLLDVGCGNGDFLVRARDAGWSVIGLDFDFQAAAHAKTRDIDVFVGSYSDAPFDLNSFDAITAHQVIEHIHDPVHFLTMLAGWLKPKGRLWIGTPNFASPFRAWYGRDFPWLHPPAHLIHFTPTSLRLIVQRAGLTQMYFRQRGFIHYTLFTQVAQLQEENHISKKECIDALMYFFGFIIDNLFLFRPELSCDLVIEAIKPCQHKNS